MGLLRSEPMKHGTLVLPVDRARDFVDLLGDKTNMQFEDMHVRDMSRPYKKYIQRIDEMERILRFLTDEIARIPEAEIEKENLDDFLVHANEYKLDDVESQLKRFHTDFVQFKENNSDLSAKRNAALEERYVVQTAMAQIGHRPAGQRSQAAQDDRFEFEASRHLLDEQQDSSRRGMDTMFSNIAGVIPQDEQDRFARALFRATRGNTFTHFQQIFEPMQDPKSGKAVSKSVFVIYFQESRSGSMMSAMGEKVTRICGSFGVNTYPWPSSIENAEERKAGLHTDVAEQERILNAHKGFVMEAASTLIEPPRLTGNSLIEDWRLFCLREKAIYCTLNMFEGHMNLRANCWYPSSEEDEIRALLIRQSTRQQGTSSAMLVSDAAGTTYPATGARTPPTYIRKNEFTTSMQTLVDLYGLPRYQEANPVLFSLVTFPFLFGVMYGDVGHGLLLFTFGIFVVIKAEDFKSIGILYQGRYMIAMMGFFAVYVGLLYNDFFSIGLDLFGSRYTHTSAQENGKEVHLYEPGYDTRNEGGAGPYPFGLDPAWHGASNELIFVNSLKMKLSVILGVTQMIVGLLLRFSNSVHEANMVDFFCECVPMMIFMICFFGFMDYMILYKWVTAMENPPSVINSLIAMGMWQTDSAPMFGNGLPKLLMAITMLTVPWMLIPKPAILYMKMKREQEQQQANGGHGGGHGVGGSAIGHEEFKAGEEEDEQHDFGEIVIHQVIETIEYVLGTVSHTASYLRLWALSLAHQQLSFVFFQKTLLAGMGVAFPYNIVMCYILFAVWFMVTLAVLMGMDVMECVLHVLRLHWIEFQSKFYKADGHGFAPYRHKDVCDDRDTGL